jgi:drug/metabolite transporter (DMT)-like permease
MTPHTTLKGVALMIIAMLILPFLDFCAKVLTQQGINPFQVVWGRVFFGALITLPFLLRSESPYALIPNLPAMHTARALLLVCSTASFFGALEYLPVADTLAIFFVQPLVTTIVSPYVLGEKVGWRRYLATLIGFCGTLIIIRPGFREFNLGIVLALAAGAMLAFYMMLTRKIQGRASAIVTNYHTNLIGAIILSAFLALFWIWPTPTQWLLMLAVSVIATAGHYLVIKALDYAEASLLAPLGYTEMVTAVFGGWYFFGDFPDAWTFVGIAVLISCAVYISLRERQIAKQCHALG